MFLTWEELLGVIPHIKKKNHWSSVSPRASESSISSCLVMQEYMGCVSQCLVYHK